MGGEHRPVIGVVAADTVRARGGGSAPAIGCAVRIVPSNRKMAPWLLERTSPKTNLNK